MIASLRKSDEISQSALAEKLGISPQNLNDIEHGRTGVSAKKAAEFARALGYSEALFIEKALQQGLNDDGLRYEVHLEELRA
jgi:transcriptional regulator with XRE-family HTH domain